MDEYIFAYSCIVPESLEELNHITEHEQAITYEELKESVNTESLNSLVSALGYNEDFKIENDWHVSFHVSKTPLEEKVYYLQHSDIEYFFKNTHTF